MATSIALKVAMGLLMLTAALELAFISSTVAWLHNTASGAFLINRPGGSPFALRGEPADLMTDQGHTSNGAAGTAFVLVGIGGIIALSLRGRPGFHRSAFSKLVYHAWLVISVLGLLLTLGALVYVMVVTGQRNWQRIDVDLASRLGDARYPLYSWTPQNWFGEVLRLDVAEAAVRNDIQTRYRIMLGWQYNLIPLFIVQLAQTVLAVLDSLRRRREEAHIGEHPVKA